MMWLNGRIYQTTEAPFDLSDRGLLLADGVFDTALIVNGKIFRQADHAARLHQHCAMIGIPSEDDQIREAMAAVSKAVTFGSVRTTVTRGPAPRGLVPPKNPKPTLMAMSAEADPTRLFAPVSLAPTTIPRNEHSPTARIKSLGYLDNILAQDEAVASGCDDALFLNTAGRIACTAMGNLFAVLDDTLITPPIREGAMPGVTRALLLSAGNALPCPVRELALTPEQLRGADGLMVTNSLRLAAPASLPAWDLGSLSIHPFITAAQNYLRKLIEQECGSPPITPAPASI